MLAARRPQLLEELRALAAESTISPASGLAEWLEALAMDPADFYGIRGASFTALRRELDWLGDAPHPGEERLSRAIAAGLLHLDDPDRLRSTAASLAAAAPPDPEALGERERRQWAMLFAQLLGTGRHWLPLGEALALLWAVGPWREELRQLLELLADRADHRLHPLPWALPVPLRVHGRTCREEGSPQPPRRRALAPAHRHRPAVHHPAPTWPKASVPEALERSPLLPHHPLPRPGPRPLPVPLGKPEHHHRCFAHRAAVCPPPCAGLTGAALCAGAAPGGRARWRCHRTVSLSGLCQLREP